MLRVHQTAWRMQMYNGCPATNFLSLSSFLKSAYEIKWNRSGNCLLLFQALISRRRYRETFLQKERKRERDKEKERERREKSLPEQGEQHSSYKLALEIQIRKAFSVIFAARRIFTLVLLLHQACNCFALLFSHCFSAELYRWLVPTFYSLVRLELEVKVSDSNEINSMDGANFKAKL